MTDINIRPAALADAQEIARIHAESWTFAYSDFLSAEILEKNNSIRRGMWQNTLEKSGDGTFVAEVDGKVVGFIGINPSQDADLIETCELTGIYLDSEHVGTGIGRELMDFAKREIAARGYKRMSLWVFEKNERARRFYEKAGLSPDGAVKSIYSEKVLRYFGDPSMVTA